MSAVAIAQPLEMGARIGLAFAFIWSVAVKARNLSALKEYLAPVFHGADRHLVPAVLVAEVTVSILLLGWSAVWPGWYAVAMIVGLTSFYAIRLSRADAVQCACWGHRAQPHELESLRSAALYPVLLAVRNGILLAAAVLVVILPSHTLKLSQLAACILLSIFATEVVVMLGLAWSILLKLRLLKRAPEEHPLTRVYAARWVRVRGCREFDLRQQGAA